MNGEEKTPLWLDLKKEYIDDNFAKLQEYLKSCSINKKKDSFFAITIDLMRQRVEDLLNTISMRPLYHEEEDRKKLEFNVGLLATYLLADGDHPLALPAYLAFMGELRTMTPRWSDNIIKASFERLRHEKVTALGFGWNDLEKIGSELFAYNASNLVRFGSPLTKPLVLSKYGTAMLTPTGLLLTCQSKSESKKLVKNGANSLDTGLGVALRTPSSEKLKQSMENNPVEIDEFANGFIALQEKVQNKPSDIQLKEYDNGDEAIIRIDAIDRNGTMHVTTIDPAYRPIIGYITFEKPSIVYYYTSTIHEYFKTGDCMRATIKDNIKGVFNIEDQLIDFFVQDTKAAEEEDNLFLCKLIDERPNFYGWINSLGIAFFTASDDGPSRLHPRIRDPNCGSRFQERGRGNRRAQPHHPPVADQPDIRTPENFAQAFRPHTLPGHRQCDGRTGGRHDNLVVSPLCQDLSPRPDTVCQEREHELHTAATR